MPNNTGHLALTAFIWQQTVFLSNHFFCSDVFGAPRSSLGAQPGFMCLTSLELIGFDELLSPTQIQSSLLPMYTNCSCLKNCLFSPCHDNRVYFFNVLLFISYCIRIAAPFFFLPAVTELSWFIEESILFSVPRRSNQSTIAVLYLGLLEAPAYSPHGQLNVFKCIFR